VPIYKGNGKKDGKQKYLVRVNFVDRLGTQRQLTRTAYGMESAKALESTLKNNVKEQGQPAQGKMTVQALFSEFITARKHEVRERTLFYYQEIFRLRIAPLLGAVRLDRLSVPVLQKWKLSVSEMPLSHSTKSLTYRVLCALLNYAVQLEYLPANPLLKIGSFKRLQAIKEKMSIYTAAGFKRFIAVAEQAAMQGALSEWDFVLFFSVAFYTGLRKGEIYALKWSDLNGGFLSVERSICQTLKGKPRETAPKTRSSVRRLQVPAPLLRTLDEHRQRQAQLQGFSDDWRVCGGVRPLSDFKVAYRCKKYAKQAGLHVIRVHDFRHSHASLLANANINVQEVARRLGHSDVKMTWNVYAHLYPSAEEKAVEVLNAV
jgi:integrase